VHGEGLRDQATEPSRGEQNVTKLRKHAAAIALAGLLALFGTACASEPEGGDGESEGAASEPAAASEAAS
jgi:hypothetical protein